MSFLDLVKKRFSARDYEARPVEKEKLMLVLEAARLAPSAANFQPWHFIVLQTMEKQDELSKMYHGQWILKAPLVIVACADRSQSWKRGNDGKDSSDIDAAIAIDHMTLMAADLGLATCWVCNFKAGICSELLDLPDEVEPIALLPLGYSNSTLPDKKRKTMASIVHYNKYGNTKD